MTDSALSIRVTDEQITEIIAEGGHVVVPAEGDFFALSTTCQTCAQSACWRLGLGAWEHTDAEGRAT